MKDHCAYPKCGKELTHVPGRKKKKYCNQTCNTRHWQMMNPTYKPKTKRVPLDKWGEIQKKLSEPKTKTVAGNSLEPKENTMAFFNKYGCNTWAEVNQNN